MPLPTIFILTVFDVAVWWRVRRQRRQLLAGALFTLPLITLDVMAVGVENVFNGDVAGVSRDATLTIVAVVVGGAAAAVMYELLLGHWLTPQTHQQRSRLWWLSLGAVTAAAVMLFGQPLSVAIVVGMLVNIVIIASRARRLIWDAVAAGLGFAVWYAVIEILAGPRASGDSAMWAIGQHPLGLTLAGLPVERVLLAAGVGVLVSPFFSALRTKRLPHMPAGVRTVPMKVVLGVLTVATWCAAVVWLDGSVVQPPGVHQQLPVPGAVAVSAGTTIEIAFTRPVNRDTLTIVSDPPLTGSWSFAAAAFDGHGYRAAQFRPDTTLLPGTTYRGTIIGVTSIWGWSGDDIPFSFTTRDLPDIERVGTETSNIGDATPPLYDPCGPLTVDLTGPSDVSIDLTAQFDPPVTVSVESGDDPSTLRLRPHQCWPAESTSRLFMERRIVIRDPETGEVVETTDPEIIFETSLHFGSAARPTLLPSVLGVATDTTLKPVRPQRVLAVAVDYQDQPLSCEAAALKMALAAKRVQVTERQIMNVVGYDRTPHRGQVWGDPDTAFVGNIDGKQNTTGYGVHWRPIARAARQWRTVKTIESGKLSDLTKAIDAGQAAVVWGTLDRAYADSWRTPSGKRVAAWKGEHARTLIGYIGPASAPTRFILNDPVAGRLTWTSATFRTNWSRFNNSAVVVE